MQVLSLALFETSLLENHYVLANLLPLLVSEKINSQDTCLTAHLVFTRRRRPFSPGFRWFVVRGRIHLEVEPAVITRLLSCFAKKTTLKDPRT